MQSAGLLRNLWLHCAAAGEQPHAMRDLPGSYVRALNRLQPVSIPLPGVPGEIALLFNLDEPRVRPLLAHFVGDAEQAARSAQVTDTPTVTAAVSGALHVLRDCDRGFEAAVRLLVGCLLFSSGAQVAGGASSSDVLGVIWLQPGADWLPLTFAESILHETTHQAVFLDDRVNGLFADELLEQMGAEAGLVTSAVWPYNATEKTRRPYDRAFHAACVAATLTEFFERLGQPERADQFCWPIPQTLSELADRQRFLTPHGVEILQEVTASLRRSPAFGRLHPFP
jgi:hypothetical protein